MRSSELKSLTLEELSEKEKELRKELFNLRFQSATGEIQNPMRIGGVRRDIARVLTVKTERAREKEARAGPTGTKGRKAEHKTGSPRRGGAEESSPP